MLPHHTTSRALLLAASLLALASAGCEDAQTQPVPVDFAISDAPVGELDSVVITIDRITVNRPGPDIVVESFPAETPGDPDVDTITIDLLDFPGTAVKLVVQDLFLMPGAYQNVRLTILDNDIALTYVDETGGGIKPLVVPSGELKLGGFYVDAFWPQTFVLEFDLSKAMTYNPSPDRYILKPRGVRIVDAQEASLLSGAVDPALFSAGGCGAKPDPLVGNVVYLYRGHGLDKSALADMFDPAVDTAAAQQWIEPFASETVAADGSYLFAYLPADSYTLAFACNAADDDSEVDDGITIPDPASEWAELTLAPGEQRQCGFPVSAPGTCGS